MREYYQSQVTNYKEFYPKNKPSGALETTVLMLRMIHKNSIYREDNLALPDSFREILRSLMTEAAVRRYQKLSEICAPFAETTEATIEAVNKLSEMIIQEVESDNAYFRRPFKRELDIVAISAESFLKFFVLDLENITGELRKAEAVVCAHKVFELYARVRMLDRKFAPLVPGCVSNVLFSFKILQI